MADAESVPRIFYVEGNIGSGKTTFLKKLAATYPYDVQVIYEPIQHWETTVDANGHSLLQYFYNDMPRYSYLFQSAVFLSRIKSLEAIDVSKKYIFVERSVDCDKLIFAQNCVHNGHMNEMEWIVYDEWHKWMCDRLVTDGSLPSPSSATYVYLRTSPDVAQARMLGRNRAAEADSVTLDYLNQIHQQHEGWLIDGRATGACATTTVTVDGTDEYLVDDAVFHRLFHRIITSAS
jgi:deoxyadenosine/deoxycytidine kinase